MVNLIVDRELNEISVLDIGGTINFWEMNLQFVPDGVISEIDVVNLPPYEDKVVELNGVTLRSYAGDALDKSTFRSNSYDLVHSNSVIEHVGNLSSQSVMAQTIPSLANYYWVQSPAKSFPLEPHFYFPFFAYLPLSLRALLVRKFNMGYHQRETGWLKSRILCEDTRLLTKKEYRHLFPDAKVVSERLMFLTKSYIATNLA